jgi:hypothetical protein
MEGKMDQPTVNNPSENNSSSPKAESSTFEMPPNVTAPEPMGQKPLGQGSDSRESQLEEPGTNPASGPKKPIFSYLLILILFLILIGGSVLFAAWSGWIKLGSLFGGGKSTPAPSTAPSISPAVSSIISPQASSSSKITSNVNDETRKTDLVKIKSVLKKYYLDKSAYPQATNPIKVSDKTSALYQALVPAFLETMPDDPQAPQLYYGYQSDGKTFSLTAVLEDKSDPAGKMTGNYYIYKITDSSVE